MVFGFAGAVVFHWCVENGLVTLAGNVRSWSPTVDSRDSGTVGRSQAGRLPTESSRVKLLFCELLAFSEEAVRVGLAVLVTGTEVEVLGAFVVVVKEEEEEDLDEDEEELLVKAAFDSSPRGLGISGASSSVVPANTLITDENADFSLRPCPCVGRPNQAAGSRDMLVSTGLHSAPTSVQVLAPVNVPDSAKTFPSAPVRTSSSVSVHNAVLASENTLSSAPVPSICGLSAVPRASERLEGTAGSRGTAASLIDSRRPGSASTAEEPCISSISTAHTAAVLRASIPPSLCALLLPVLRPEIWVHVAGAVGNGEQRSSLK